MFKNMFQSQSSESDLGLSESDNSPNNLPKGKRISIEIGEVFDAQTHSVLKLPDPYIIAYLNDTKVYRTKTRQNGINQVFYETFDVAIGFNYILKFELFDSKRLGVDELLGEIEIPLQSLYLEEGETRYKTFPFPNSFKSRFNLKLTARGFSQCEEEHKKREVELDNDLKKKRNELVLSKQAEKRSQKDVKVFYYTLEKILESKDDDMELLVKRLQTLLGQVEEALSVYKNNDFNFLTKTTDFLRGLKTLFNDSRGVDQGDLHQLIQNVGVPLTMCLGDVVYAMGQTLLKMKKQDDAYEFLLKFETEYFEHPDVTKLLDQIEAHRFKSEKYAFLYGQRIHIPPQYKAKQWPKHLSKDVISCFFSWVVYEHRPRWMFGRVWNEKVDSRLSGYGNWTITSEFHSEDYQLGFHCLFAFNPELDTVILTVRGTELLNKDRRFEGINEWMANLDFHLTDYPLERGVKIHKGFCDQFLSCKDELLEQVQQYLKKGHKIIIAGHSRGGAIATVIAYHIGVHFGTMATQNIYCVTFGSPRVGNFDFQKGFNRIYPNSKRYVAFKRDILKIEDYITTIPYSDLGFAHVGLEVELLAQTKFYGNPQVIPGIGEPIELDKYKLLKEFDSILMHSQQVYMDGLVEMHKIK